MSEEWSQMEGELMRRGRELVPLQVPMENLVESYFQDGADPISPWEQEPDGVAAVADTLLPFQITATPTLLRAEPGVLAGSAIAAVQEADPPIDTTWYAEASVTIDNTTGAITDRSVDWVSGFGSTDTATKFHLIIGTVEKYTGMGGETVIDITQYTYGPILEQRSGAIDAKWKLTLF